MLPLTILGILWRSIPTYEDMSSKTEPANQQDPRGFINWLVPSILLIALGGLFLADGMTMSIATPGYQDKSGRLYWFVDKSLQHEQKTKMIYGGAMAIIGVFLGGIAVRTMLRKRPPAP